MNKNSLNLFLIIPAILLILAPLISFPYGFYMFLRLIVTITSIIIIIYNIKAAGGVNEITISFGLIAILYNPIIPVNLTREIWMPINFVTSGIYMYCLFKIRKN